MPPENARASLLADWEREELDILHYISPDMTDGHRWLETLSRAFLAGSRIYGGPIIVDAVARQKFNEVVAKIRKEIEEKCNEC